MNLGFDEAIEAWMSGIRVRRADKWGAMVEGQEWWIGASLFLAHQDKPLRPSFHKIEGFHPHAGKPRSLVIIRRDIRSTKSDIKMERGDGDGDGLSTRGDSFVMIRFRFDTQGILMDRRGAWRGRF